MTNKKQSTSTPEELTNKLQEELGGLSFNIINIKKQLEAMEEDFKIKSAQLGAIQSLSKDKPIKDS